MKTWITSDIHFSHTSILGFCPTTRPYSNIEEMDNAMIRDWNTLVNPEDTVYILGDVAFCNGNQAAKFVSELNGTKILIYGNHDKNSLKTPAFVDCFKEIHVLHNVKYKGEWIVMCHFPIYDHERAAYGSLMLHGHRHGNPTGIPGRIMDVGLDATGKIVSDLDEIVTHLKTITPMHHHPRQT